MPAEHEPARVRCARCLDVVWSANPWERVSCRCGAVTLSGLPWRPRVDWYATSAGGWSFVEDGAVGEVPSGSEEGTGGEGDVGAEPPTVDA